MKQNQKARKKYTRPHRAGKKPADRQNFEKEILRVLQRAGNRGASAKYLQEQAGVRRHQTESFLLTLAGMVKKGEVQQKRDRYYREKKDRTAQAVVVKVTEGFGFVRPDEEQEIGRAHV